MNTSMDFFGKIDRCLSNIDNLSIYYQSAIIQAREGSFIPSDKLNIDPRLKSYLKSSYPGGLYHHQHKAVDLYSQDKNIIATTQTASGKSLIYAIPAFNEVLKDEKATVLFLYPQKALANDQLNTLCAMWRSLIGEEKVTARVARFDGSIDSLDRGLIKKCGQFILTNPEMLHLSMLGWHKHWDRFFRNLKLVVIDEVHEYTGAFGGNVAYLIRRLRNLCKLYGSDPRFISTSATIEHPLDHIKTITGLDFSLIDSSSDTSTRGAKKYYLAGTEELHHYDFIRNLIQQFKTLDLSTLVFCPGRKQAETLAAQHGKAVSEGWLRVYRSGLSHEERTEIETGLKSGNIKTVFCTSALELGIDIGSLDVVVCIGVPPTMMSFMQRSGRIARVNKPGAVIIVPTETPIDSYYAAHASELFDRKMEKISITLNNSRLANRHAACALNEVENHELLNYEVLGENIQKAVGTFLSANQIPLEFGSSQPHGEFSMRGNFSGQYEIRLNQSVIGTIDDYHLLREAFPFAVYRHGGNTYEVIGVNQLNRVVRIKPHYEHSSTTPFIHTKILRGQMMKSKSNNHISIINSYLTATQSLLGASKKSLKGETLPCAFKPGMLKSLRYTTTGSYLHIKPAFAGFLSQLLPENQLCEALSGCVRLFAQLFSTVVTNCASQDISSTFEMKGDSIYIYLFDQVEGGIDITIGAYSKWEQLTDRVIERIEQCDCQEDTGCFRCIANPDEHESVSKTLSLKFLYALKDKLSGGDFCEQIFEASCEISAPSYAKTCNACGSSEKIEAKFCSNCGEKFTDQLL